jgi:transposase
VLTLPPSVRIWLATEPVDLRKGFDGLAAIVRNAWKKDLFAGHLFVFVGKRGDRCKVLLWDRGGMAIYYKRLERGRFRVPRVLARGTHVEMDATELAMLLDGIDFGRVRRARHWQPPVQEKIA